MAVDDKHLDARPVLFAVEYVVKGMVFRGPNTVNFTIPPPQNVTIGMSLLNLKRESAP